MALNIFELNAGKNCLEIDIDTIVIYAQVLNSSQKHIPNFGIIFYAPDAFTSAQFDLAPTFAGYQEGAEGHVPEEPPSADLCDAKFFGDFFWTEYSR